MTIPKLDRALNLLYPFIASLRSEFVMLRWQALLATTVLLVPSSGIWAQIPNNGYIGVFSDPAATVLCTTVSAPSGVNLYVIGYTLEPTVKGAEFRIEFSNTQNVFIGNFVPPPNATMVVGDAVDLTACDGSPAGVSLYFDECVNGPNVLLGVISMFVLPDANLQVAVRRRIPAFEGPACPLFVRCDAPTFTPVCLTLEAGDPQLGGYEPASLISGINHQQCYYWGSANFCQPVGVEARQWSDVKVLYR